MKKIHTLWVCLGLFTFVALSCQREPVSSESAGTADARMVTLTVSASSPEEEGEKTYIDEDNKILWQTGEQMKLFIQPADQPLVAVASAALSSDYNGQSTASFSFAVPPVQAESYLYQGVYPLSACVSANNADMSAYKVVLPAVQTNASGGVYDPSAYIMIAVPSTKTKLNNWDDAAFRRAVALNELTLNGLPDGVTRVEIIAPEGQYLAGGRAFNLSTGADGAVYDGTRTIEINFDSALSSGDQTIRFCSWPVTMAAGSSLTVIAYTSTKSNTRTLSIPNGKPINLVQGKLNRFTVNMSTATEADRYFSSGNGTAISPWRIASSTDLKNLASYISVGAANTDRKAALEDDYYLQTADIDFNNGYLESIGNSNASPYSYFKGTYLGNGYKVSNAKIRNQQTKKSVGFFGYLANAAHVDGICLENCTVDGGGGTWNVGSIVGCIQPSSSTVLENCNVIGVSLSADQDNAGGICGKHMSGVIRNCTSSGTVNTGKYCAGGIVGYISSSNCTVSNCTSSCSVTGPEYVGGIVGYNNEKSVIIEDCTFSGSAMTTGDNKGDVGGICGYVDKGITIRRCQCLGATVETTNGNRAGGILGTVSSNATDISKSVISNCYVDADSEVEVQQGNAGGILGACEAGVVIVNLCTAACNVTSTDTGNYGWVGGIVGRIYGTTDALVANCCYAGGELSNSGTNGDVAGIVGLFEGHTTTLGNVTVFNCCAFPTRVYTRASNANIAGIAGYFSVATIRNCYCPTAISAFDYGGSTDGGGSRGSIYGWMRGYDYNATYYSYQYSAKVLDVYWLSGWKAGNYAGSFQYIKKEQALTDTQMRNTGSVTRPSTSVSYDCFIDALNADVAAWNAGSPLHSVQGVTWVLGSNGYPVPSGLPQ